MLNYIDFQYETRVLNTVIYLRNDNKIFKKNSLSFWTKEGLKEENYIISELIKNSLKF